MTNPELTDPHFQGGLSALQAGRLDDAERLFGAVLHAEPKHVGALNLMGVALMQLNRFAEAETYFRRALQHSSSDATLYNYGIVLKALNRPAEALQCFSQALKINPSIAETWNNRGTAFNDLKRYDEAIADFDKAIAIKPRYAEAQYNKAKSLGALKRGDEALAAFERALSINSNLAEAWLGSGNVLLDRKEYQKALEAYDRAVAIKTDLVEAWLSRGNVFFELKQWTDALGAYERALRLRPNFAQAWVASGKVAFQCKRYDEAFAAYERALQLDPALAEAWLGRGTVSFERQQFEKALEDYEKALALKADLAAAWLARGNIYVQQTKYDEALAAYDKADFIRPDLAETWLCRGNLFFARKNFEKALAAYNRARELKFDFAEAWIGRGNTLVALKRYDEALAACDQALALKPELAEAWLGRGNVFFSRKQYSEALTAYDQGVSVQSDLAGAWAGRGDALVELQRYDEAISAYRKALALRPDLSDLWRILGDILSLILRYSDAFVAYEKSASLQPDLNPAVGARLFTKLRICDWTNLKAEVAQILSTIKEGKTASTPMSLFGIPASPSQQLQCARRYVQDQPACPATWRGEVYVHDRIRVAYVSPDLREHPVAYLTAGLFERHDKTRFETTAISIWLGSEHDSDFCRRIKSSFGRFIVAGNRSDKEIADMIQQLEIDIVVDLYGFGGLGAEGRLGLFARRSAPIQVNYLGYPGTMGADYYDYIIADSTVIPDQHFKFYSESVVWLPRSFQPNDSARCIAERTPTRSELNLPETGFVFCCFNQAFKIDPTIFDIWMRLLKQVSGSVLWLKVNNTTASHNLCREAVRRGVAPERLVFAPSVSRIEDHLARLRQADLFLDTFHFNAHTTASDALWAGLPVITCLGSTYAGRVAASLNRAVGLSELVTETPLDYEALALKIAREPSLLASLKTKLARNRESCPLFDTVSFTRHLETAYTTMWQRYQNGESPTSFAIRADESPFLKIPDPSCDQART